MNIRLRCNMKRFYLSTQKRVGYRRPLVGESYIGLYATRLDCELVPDWETYCSIIERAQGCTA
jgi:hypothetical protein